MQNHAPIFLNCFSRGGSNILWNIFLSHPDVCSPISETLEIFRLDAKGLTRAGLRAVWLTRQLRFFNQWALTNRRTIAASAQHFIDKTLFEHKLLTLDDEDMRYCSQDRIYSRDKVVTTRLVAKNNNGLIFLTDIWLDMYPKADFFALLREPLALYESHKRRKIARSPADFASFYTAIARKMLADAARLTNYHIFKFEDLLRDPVAAAHDLYTLASLDSSKVTMLRFKAKPYMQADGRHASERRQGEHYWLSPAEARQFLSPAVNQHQINRLSTAETGELMEYLGSLREELGYQ